MLRPARPTPARIVEVAEDGSQVTQVQVVGSAQHKAMSAPGAERSSRIAAVEVAIGGIRAIRARVLPQDFRCNTEREMFMQRRNVMASAVPGTLPRSQLRTKNQTNIALFLDECLCDYSAATWPPLPARIPMSDRLQCSLQAIDAANARDPTHDAGEPAEFIYGRRMSEALAAFAPGATEPLRIAVRGQHIERWLSPRRAFPEGKAGYFGWRNAAKKRHAERLGQIMAACGYDEAVIARVGTLARKEQLRNDAEAQTLEDVGCLVFLRYYEEKRGEAIDIAVSIAGDRGGSSGRTTARTRPGTCHSSIASWMRESRSSSPAHISASSSQDRRDGSH
jgi:hypothetical protein